MKSDFGPVTIANMIMMMRADVDQAIWIVDDEDESRFYENLAHTGGRVVPAFGGAVATLREIAKRGIQGVIGVLCTSDDALNELPAFRPDIGDAASILLYSKGANRVLGEIFGAAWLAAAGKEFGDVLEKAIFIAAHIESLTIDFPSESDLLEIINWRTIEVDIEKIGILERKTEVFSEEKADMLQARPADSRNKLFLCNGINVISVISAFSRAFHPRGIHAYREVSASEVFGMLRAAYNIDEFEADDVFWRMKAWQWKNIRFSLFREWRKKEPFQILFDQRYIKDDIGKLVSHGFLFAAIQLDLDNFKNVNETLGHIEGDAAIELAERILITTLSGHGEAYRRGGDELVAILAEADPAKAEIFVEVLRKKIEEEFSRWSADRNLNPAPTASIGLVHISSPQSSVDDVIKKLEEAQMLAKRSGKNQCICFRL